MEGPLLGTFDLFLKNMCRIFFFFFAVKFGVEKGNNSIFRRTVGFRSQLPTEYYRIYS